MEKLEKLKQDLNPFLWQKHFDKTLEELIKLDKENILNKRKEMLARVLSIAKSHEIKYDEAVFFEIGSGQFIHASDLNMNEKFFTKSVYRFFLKHENFLKYYGFDSMSSKYLFDRLSEENILARSNIETIKKQTILSFEELKEKQEKTLEEGKIPIIFSNLTIGYLNKEEDGKEDEYNLPIWNLRGLHIHQYFNRDLIKSANNWNEEKNKITIENKKKHFVEINMGEFNEELSKLFEKRYGLENDIYSLRVKTEEPIDTISIWVNS